MLDYKMGKIVTSHGLTFLSIKHSTLCTSNTLPRCMSFTYAKNVSVFKTTELTEIKHVVADVTLNVCITKHTQKVLNISV